MISKSMDGLGLMILLSWIASASAVFNLTILHTNDIHSHFEQSNKYGSACSEQEAAADQCFGGYPRLVHMSRQLRQNDPNTILLSGGDSFQGTVWYTVHKWKAVSHFDNLLNYTAASLGNHEFDDGIDGLVPCLKAANRPILSANIDTSQEPSLQGLLGKSFVTEVGGQKIGIIGYLTPETSTASQSGKVIFKDEIESINAEASLLSKSGVKIIIAVGHSGYLKDIEIAGKCPLIDVVVGGHSHSFLWTGSEPSNDLPQGPYPTVVKQLSGRSVPVVQAYAFGKYLGNLKVTFDENGEVVSAAGLPILLDKSVQQDSDTMRVLLAWKQEVDAVALKEVGTSRVFLDGDRLSCRRYECNMGNLLTDSFVNHFIKYAEGDQWTKASIAITNGGSVRASIDEHSNNGSITYGDVRTAVPFSNTIDLVKLTGQTLKDAFEFSVSKYETSFLDPYGGFLQVSGVQVTYDISRPKGERVVELYVRCNDCRIPAYDPIKLDQIYDILMPSFLVSGGDGYSVIADNIVKHTNVGVLDYDVLIEYIGKYSPITVGLERRIKFTNIPTSKNVLKK